MLVSKADFFGYSLQPTFKGKAKINTSVGGIMSIILFCLFSTGFFYMGKEIIEKKNPISNISAIRTTDASIPLKDIPIIIALISDSGEFLHFNQDFNRAAKLGANLYEISGSENGEVTFSTFKVPIIRCTEEFLGEDDYKTLKAAQAGADYLLCLDYKNITTIDGSPYPNGIPAIRNPFGYQNSAHLNVNLLLCDEKEDSGCRKGIEAVGSFHFVFFHPQDILNISSSDSPIFTEFKGTQTTTFVGLSFSQVINFNINELVSDEGWILEMNNTQVFYTADAPIYNATQFSESDRTIGRFIFAMNLAKNVANRRYMKLQELIANLGGFIKATMIVFSLILKNYSKWVLYKEIIRVEAKSSETVLANSTVLVNNIVNSSIAVLDIKKKLKLPSFWEFTLAMVNKNFARKHNVNWEDCTKHLDLIYMKKQSEELNLALKNEIFKE